MKKRHLIRLTLSCIIGFSVFLTMIFDVFCLCYVETHNEEYYITDAVVTNISYKARDIYVSTLSFEHNGVSFEKNFSHDLSDYIGKKDRVAINKENGKSVRLRIMVDYVHVVFIVVGPLLLLIEYIRYKKEKEKYIDRKMRELNKFNEE